MLLILIRHGEAVPETVDPNRPLSAHGREEVERSARFLKNAGVNANLFYHSTKKRAEETAYIVRAILNPQAKLEKKAYLSPDDPLDEILKDLAKVKQNLLIAGLPIVPVVLVVPVVPSFSPSFYEFRNLTFGSRTRPLAKSPPLFISRSPAPESPFPIPPAGQFSEAVSAVFQSDDRPVYPGQRNKLSPFGVLFPSRG